MQKVVNASCVERHVYSNIEARNQPCFDKCLHQSGGSGAALLARGQAEVVPPNRSSACVNSCFQSAVIGTTSGSSSSGEMRLAPMTAAEILAPWTRAFAAVPGPGVCPPCVLDAVTGAYSCPTPW